MKPEPVLAVAFASRVRVPRDIGTVDIAKRRRAPSWPRPFWTEPFGRDILSMIVVGRRSSRAMAPVTASIGMGMAAPNGFRAAARRGSPVDEVISGADDMILAFPSPLAAVPRLPATADEASGAAP